ncbi:hypothetical protein BOX15_Mlig022828g2 [Macrostomum lignano]|uniref:Uncharacterized protein n=2 Tax=Macrostomum lignano TaxID=282301 RepID=A0A267FZN6_9PLAT|nr:hypothetical protein BOX15_Mlig022828g2 [Macrostomum lignano]
MIKQARSLADLTDTEFSGKVVLITGASGGIGEAAALEFARRQAKVIMLVRSLERGKLARDRIWEKHPAADLHLVCADISLVRSVAAFCRGFSEPHIDILVNNAGIFGAPFELTKEGVESTLAVNHLGHFVLTCMLLSKGQLSQGAKVILVTGAVYKRGNFEVSEWNSWTEESYKKMKAYSNSKLAVCLFALWLRSALRRLSSATAMVYAVHPGVVCTDIGRHVVRGCIAPCRPCLRCCMRCMMLSPRQGCKGILLRAADMETDSGKSGRYFNKCRSEPWHKPVLNSDLVTRCWDFSFELVKQALGDSDDDVLNRLKKLRELPQDTLADLEEQH